MELNITTDTQPINTNLVLLKNYLITLMCICDQLRINHWETECFAEHKLTDNLEGELRSKLDLLGECVMGNFDRLKFDRQTILLDDIDVTSTETALAFICKTTKELIMIIKDTEYYDIENILCDILTLITQAIYLSKLK